MSAENSVEIQVVAESVKGLSDKVEAGFKDIKDLIKEGSLSLGDHVKDDKVSHNNINKEIELIKIDLAKFKERWYLIGAVISLVATALAEIITHNSFIKTN